MKGLITAGLIIIIILEYRNVWLKLAVFENQQCAGFIGRSCPAGYICKIPHPYPDAAGSCKFLGF